MPIIATAFSLAKAPFQDPDARTVTDAPAADSTWAVCLCAEWCGTCRDYRALFAEAQRTHPQLRFAWVDVEDHADLADEFDVETFPTLLLAGPQGVHFLGPMLPHAGTLARMLDSPPAARPADAAVTALLQALGSRQDDAFAVEDR